MILISDANVLIDMADGGRLEAMFHLKDTFAAPNVLYEEELESRHPELPGLGLVCMTLEVEGVIEAYRLRATYTGRAAPSQNDLFALMLARQESCPLLTGDGRLRSLVQREYADVELRGTLWVVEQMVREGIITTGEARATYRRMKDAGGRLPWKEAERRLKTFE